MPRKTMKLKTMKLKLPWHASRVLHGFLRPFKSAAIAAMVLATNRGSGLLLPIRRRTDTTLHPSVVVLEKRKGRIRSLAFDMEHLRSHKGFGMAWRRLPSVLDIVSHPDFPEGTWPASLGDFVHDDGLVIGFCSNRSESLLIPDRGFHNSHGYEAERKRGAEAPPFDDRDPTLTWRGSPSGQGDFFAPRMDAGNTELRQRVRMCLALRDQSIPRLGQVDARCVLASRELARPGLAEAFRAARIVGDFVPQHTWADRQFAIDIDGVSNAFSNLFIRLLYGCCVIKIASPFGYRQWYYDRLEPWRHFVPVSEDLTDLVDVLTWCGEHPRECREIAAAGHEVAMSMTHTSERNRVVADLRTRIGGRSEIADLSAARRSVPGQAEPGTHGPGSAVASPGSRTGPGTV